MALTPSQYQTLLILKQNQDKFLKEKEIRNLYSNTRKSSLNYELKALAKLGLAKRRKNGRAYEYQYDPILKGYSELYYHFSKKVFLKNKHGKRNPVDAYTLRIQERLQEEKIIDENGLFEFDTYPNSNRVRWEQE